MTTDGTPIRELLQLVTGLEFQLTTAGYHVTDIELSNRWVGLTEVDIEMSAPDIDSLTATLTAALDTLGATDDVEQRQIVNGRYDIRHCSDVVILGTRVGVSVRVQRPAQDAEGGA